MALTETTKGIPHIEDIPVLDLVKVLRNLDDYTITEKVDGAQILFGIDNKGFYTSRETKGGKRIYKEEDYGITFSSTYIRSAHKLLEQVLPRLRGAGLSLGDQVEAEVLYGSLPNVVPYSEDTNYLIFLRTTEGDVNIDRLKEKLDGLSLSISLVSPYTTDGRTILQHECTNTWQFSRAPFIPAVQKVLDEKLNPLLTTLSEFLREKSGIRNIPNFIIETTPLNKCPDWCKPDAWKETKEIVRETREEIRAILDEHFIMEIKSVLLDNLVHNFPSRFGPRLEDNGWIEGVVLRHKDTGFMVKVVDKAVFGILRDFSWRERNKLIERARSDETATSFLGKLYVTMAASLGYPALGTTHAKSYLRKMGESPDKIVSNLADLDVEMVCNQWNTILQEAEEDLTRRLDKYEAEKEKYSIRVFRHSKPLDAEYTGSVDRRTEEVFASMFELIRDLKHKTSLVTSHKDLLYVIAGKQMEDLT